jgi:lipopolysaccharide/colanic/teichoic acid biosynthesis glycosyltransferase
MRQCLLPSSRHRPKVRIGIGEAVAGAISPLIAFALRDPSFFREENLDTLLAYDGVGVGSTLAAVSVSRLGRSLPRYFSHGDVASILKIASASVALTVMAMFAATRMTSVPRTLPLIHLIVLFLTMTGGRWLLGWLDGAYEAKNLPQPAQSPKNILVVGANKWAWLYAHIIDSMTTSGQKILAILDPDPRILGRTIHGHPIIGAVEEIDAILDEYAVHGVSIERVVISGRREDVEAETWAFLSNVCRRRGIKCDAFVDCLGPFYDASEIEEQMFSPLAPAPGRLQVPHNRRIKRAFDICFASLSLVVLWPLFLLAFLSVLLTLGMPTIFWQQRVGSNGKPLLVYKFRTLRAPYRKDGAPIGEELRLSRIGRLMRATRLDELPQIINVLRGDMSIVGPRPLLKSDQPHNPEIRLSVAPGLTGWAQIHGGKLIAAAEKNALDEWYVRNWSVWLDIRIIARTLIIVLTGDKRDEGVLWRVLEDNESYADDDRLVSADATDPRVLRG